MFGIILALLLGVITVIAGICVLMITLVPLILRTIPGWAIMIAGFGFIALCIEAIKDGKL